jgi:excinuclease UvrABC ATPase subunit
MTMIGPGVIIVLGPTHHYHRDTALGIIRCSDYVIDVGPEGGIGGGRIVAAGTPEEVAAVEDSHTGRFLRTVL